MPIHGVDELARDVPLLAGLDEHSHALVTGCASTSRFEAGALLAREGTPANVFFALREGRVAIEVATPARTVVIETLGVGEVCGWSWLVAPYRWQFDVRALEPVRALTFDGACMRSKIEQDDALGYALMRRFTLVMLERLQATRLQLVDVYRNSAG